MTNPHYHIWILEQLQGQWAYVVRRETYASSGEAHQRQDGGDYIVTPCVGASPACPLRG